MCVSRELHSLDIDSRNEMSIKLISNVIDYVNVSTSISLYILQNNMYLSVNYCDVVFYFSITVKSILCYAEITA